MELAQEKGTSSWLTSLTHVKLSFFLYKGAFWDALGLRYRWSPTPTPTHCACGIPFSVQHALSCPKGGFPTLRNNKMMDFTAKVLSEVCHDVCVELHLQPLSWETLDETSAITTDGARLHVTASGFWGGRHEWAFLASGYSTPSHSQTANLSLLATGDIKM